MGYSWLVQISGLPPKARCTTHSKPCIRVILDNLKLIYFNGMLAISFAEVDVCHQLFFDSHTNHLHHNKHFFNSFPSQMFLEVSDACVPLQIFHELMGLRQEVQCLVMMKSLSALDYQHGEVNFWDDHGNTSQISAVVMVWTSYERVVLLIVVGLTIA